MLQAVEMFLQKNLKEAHKVWHASLLTRTPTAHTDSGCLGDGRTVVHRGGGIRHHVDNIYPLQGETACDVTWQTTRDCLRPWRA